MFWLSMGAAITAYQTIDHGGRPTLRYNEPLSNRTSLSAPKGTDTPGRCIFSRSRRKGTLSRTPQVGFSGILVISHRCPITRLRYNRLLADRRTQPTPGFADRAEPVVRMQCACAIVGTIARERDHLVEGTVCKVRLEQERRRITPPNSQS